MNALTLPSWLLLRITAPLVWRRDAKIAKKLDGFAATEAGSALDMLKAADKAMTLGPIRLLEKTGGRSGTYQAADR